jgi:tagatose-1,6-bisphosphate aldolase
MRPLSIGKFRGLQQIASSRGTFAALALDHRQNLRRALNPGDPAAVADAELTSLKLEVAAALAGEATAVLLDPEYSAAEAVAAGVIPNKTGLVVALESTGYTGDPTARRAQILPGWSVEKAKRMGASAVKLLVYYHPDSPTAKEIETFIERVAEDCRSQDLALMLEPLSYSLAENGRLAAAEKRWVVVQAARRLTPLGVDVLKAAFPLDSADPDPTRWMRPAPRSVGLVVPWICSPRRPIARPIPASQPPALQAGAASPSGGRSAGVSLTKRRDDFHTADRKGWRGSPLCATRWQGRSPTSIRPPSHPVGTRHTDVRYSRRGRNQSRPYPQRGCPA